MNLCRIATVIMVAAALLVTTVAAQETSNHNYIVTPAGETITEDNPPFTPMTAGSITQGETKWYSIYIAPGTMEFAIDLNWGDASNSLRLRIYAPDTVLGPYYDAYDGVDGRLYLQIKNSNDSVPLHPGTWRFEVYGHQVTGTQDYTFTWQ
ncbi:hypothetical protein KH990_01670 [Methanoculleus bourgensis]|jgi:hypothetical protein|uniref:hypothetical protein n=1 Tax=Methanoculleus TaxID=45989 RepID=UPI0007BCA5CD|nr:MULTISPECIES: hypothetical protein [Methanoculleus]MBT0732087.1 hypothetical protein [Methanoculleus bourgensis]MDD3373221.1 hypothetical protein [Methanoculleus bourgensis]SAI89030.1 hypothetical protein MBBA_2186 [Methanoculleus bourgensis]